jgi:hypothetical protein
MTAINDYIFAGNALSLERSEWDLLSLSPGTGISVEKRIPLLGCAAVGMTTSFRLGRPER